MLHQAPLIHSVLTAIERAHSTLHYSERESCTGRMTTAAGARRLIDVVPRWGLALLIATIPAGTYGWMLYTRPNIYTQVAEEVKRQEEAEKQRLAGTSRL
jgi:hypothetical protein